MRRDSLESEGEREMAGIPLSPMCSFCPNMYLYPSGEDVREEGAEGVPEEECQEIECTGERCALMHSRAFLSYIVALGRWWCDYMVLLYL